MKYSWNQDFSIDDNLEANYVDFTGNLNYGYRLDIHKVTYTYLVNLKNNAQLTSGRFYQITDYITTTTQENTRSAGHPFDVIVLALSENELSERAWAIQHEGDTYFANSDLNAWHIWYCLDNDTNRFSWADSVNGKGVIYRMIDEWNNDVPYDFKNIQFKHPKNTTTYPYYYYTFASDNTENNTDYSLSIANKCYSNTIMEYIDADKRMLNCIIFIGIYCHSNSFDYGCYNNTFGSNCLNNSFGAECRGNTFGNTCYNNTFGPNCTSNTFGYSCQCNSFGPECNGNKAGNSFNSNSFGNLSGNNYFKDDCHNNSFGNSCHGNLFNNYCSNNSFGNNCDFNQFGDYFSNNSFGNYCDNIQFKLYNLANYYQYNHFGDGCKYIYLEGPETASSTSQVQNYNFAQGLQGTSDNFLVVEGKRNRPYDTKVAKNSNGELKIYCEADSIQ